MIGGVTMKELTLEELYQIEGGGWLKDLVKKIPGAGVVLTGIEIVYDIGSGIKKGWNAYSN